MSSKSRMRLVEIRRTEEPLVDVSFHELVTLLIGFPSVDSMPIAAALTSLGTASTPAPFEGKAELDGQTMTMAAVLPGLGFEVVCLRADAILDAWHRLDARRHEERRTGTRAKAWRQSRGLAGPIGSTISKPRGTICELVGGPSHRKKTSLQRFNLRVPTSRRTQPTSRSLKHHLRAPGPEAFLQKNAN